jgi:hypothetical protein
MNSPIRGLIILCALDSEVNGENYSGENYSLGTSRLLHVGFGAEYFGRLCARNESYSRIDGGTLRQSHS